MAHPPPHTPPPPLNRRDFLSRVGMGLAMSGLGGVMADEGRLAAATAGSSMAPQPPHFSPKAKAVIHIFMNGGPSHVDTFDPKPLLNKMHGKMLPAGSRFKTERETGAAFGCPFKFKQYGQSGIPVSDIFRHVGEQIDDICVIRSMQAQVPNHEPSLMLMNCGDSVLVRPSMGSWITYGLGTANQNLPGYVAMCPGGHPIKKEQNWQSAFLPGIYQGTYVDTKSTDVRKLIANIKNPHLGPKQQRRQLDLLAELNRRHLEKRGADPQLEARIASYELAYRMQAEATDAFDISREPTYIRDMYGNSKQARQILIARRLVERGVRFVQLWHGNKQPWDNHDDLEKNHRRLAGQCSQAIGALIQDLKQRGLLEDTLIWWGGEFGRTPFAQGKNGRDHNPRGFTVFLAGGGVKPGIAYGATDELGDTAVEGKVHMHDLHATLLHLLGLDHLKLTYRYAGRDFRLTDVAGEVVHPIIA